MIGRLLHLGTGGGNASNSSQPPPPASRPVASLESVQEDTHTRNLLFPDPQAIFQSRNDQVFPLSGTPLTPPAAGITNAYDSNEEIDLDVPDVRVLVMQDTLGHANASLLYDSHPGPTVPPAPERGQGIAADPRRTNVSSRKGSIGQPSRPLSFQAGSPQGRHGAFDRRGSLHGRTPSASETDAQRAAREYRDELATFSSCIFGNSELMAYKGTSTKVHVVPGDTRASEHPASLMGDGRTSLGRSSARSSKLSQSFTSYTASLNTASGAALGARSGDKKKVLITRLFPVNLANEDGSVITTPQSRYSDENNGYPFPVSGEDGQPAKKKPLPRQRRTPMYAVVLVVQLSSSSRASAVATPKSIFRESGSYTEQDVFSSSYSSTRPSWWQQSGDANDSSFSADVEDRIDSLTQHWDIIMRTLTHMQSVVAATIGTMLRQVDVASPDPSATSIPPSSIATPRMSTLPDRRSGEFSRVKPPKTTVKLVTLWPNCLATDMNIATEVNIARRRIVTGIKASRVVTGQGRWGIWRDEAIWTSKWALDLGQSSFLDNLLTGFLSTHTDWLQALSPPSLRKRFLNGRQNRDSDDLSLPSRTIIVADDKMAARRLVFLLSAFLPANQQLPATRPHRPSTSTSIGGFAHSPPTYVVPVLREESLRRKINRRSNRRTSHSRTMSQSTRTGGLFTQTSQEGAHERRVSDAGSIRPSSIALPGNDIMRKSSVATTATILPETTTPHFSSIQRMGSSRRSRPESSGSVATDDLKRSLKRGDSSSHMSSASTDSRSQGSRWGSVISGLWSPRRRDSTSMTSPTPSQPEDTRSPTKSSPVKRNINKLSEMVQEASILEMEQGSPTSRALQSGARDVSTPREQTARPPRPSFSQADRTPDPTGAFDSPVKTSINEEDGVIDVDFPFPDYIASFESAISSPSSSGYLSTPGLGAVDTFEQTARISLDMDLPLNAAGWLNSFHPDFCLQAIPPQEDLMDTVKATLRSEPTPKLQPHASGPKDAEHWVDVGRALIAETTTNTIRRIVYRRLIKPRQHADHTHDTSGVNTSGRIPNTSSTLPNEIQLEEEFVEELVYKPDRSLVEALEKVMKVQAGPNDSPLARSTSRTDSDSDHTLSDHLQDTGPQLNNGPLEVPRVQCKTIVLSALEDIIREAVEHQDKPNDELDNAGGRYQSSLLHESVHRWVSNIDKSD